jgi:parallel beta-helix repeat protein
VYHLYTVKMDTGEVPLHARRVLQGADGRGRAHGDALPAPPAQAARAVEVGQEGLPGQRTLPRRRSSACRCTTTSPTITSAECLVNDNGNHGIELGYGGSIVQCTTSGNNGVGIATGYGCTIDRCTITYSNYYGIDAGTGSSVANCTVRYNTWDGIRVNAECTVRDNTCTRNGWGYTGTAITGAGIRLHTSATGCRVEGNNCTFQKRGVHVEAAGNFITRNTCKGNATNWQIVAGNACLVVNAVMSGAITGNAGGVSPGSSDPNANFTY